MSLVEQSTLQNRILRSLAPEDFALLRPDLKPRTVGQRSIIFEADEPLQDVYFPESGIVSLVTPGADSTEVGVIGKDGFVGVHVVLGVDRTPFQAFGQIAGHGHTIRTENLSRACAKNSTVRDKLSIAAYLYLVQAKETAYANANYTVEQRLARWVLMCQDRVGNELELTHEFIAMMLGVRRPGVTVATHVLEGHHFIRATRGRITVRNRQGLEGFAGGSYGMAEREVERLLGPLVAVSSPSATLDFEGAPIAV